MDVMWTARMVFDTYWFWLSFPNDYIYVFELYYFDFKTSHASTPNTSELCWATD